MIEAKPEMTAHQLKVKAAVKARMKLRITECVRSLGSSDHQVVVHSAKEHRKGLVHRFGSNKDIIERNTSVNAHITKKYYQRQNDPEKMAIAQNQNDVRRLREALDQLCFRHKQFPANPLFWTFYSEVVHVDTEERKRFIEELKAPLKEALKGAKDKSGTIIGAHRNGHASTLKLCLILYLTHGDVNFSFVRDLFYGSANRIFSSST